MRVKGVGDNGPMGVGRIAEEISAANDLTRSDKPWSVQAIKDILREKTYIGQHHYHLHHLESASEKNSIVRDVVVMPCPAMVDLQVFNKAQDMMDAANPRMRPARLTNGSLMLTGLLHCATCGAMMHIITGKGDSSRPADISSSTGGSPWRGWSVPDIDRLDDEAAAATADQRTDLTDNGATI